MCVFYTERLGQRKARFKPSVCQGSRNEEEEEDEDEEDEEQEVLQCHRTKGRCDAHTVVHVLQGLKQNRIVQQAFFFFLKIESKTY